MILALGIQVLEPWNSVLNMPQLKRKLRRAKENLEAILEFN